MVRAAAVVTGAAALDGAAGRFRVRSSFRIDSSDARSSCETAATVLPLRSSASALSRSRGCSGGRGDGGRPAAVLPELVAEDDLRLSARTGAGARSVPPPLPDVVFAPGLFIPREVAHGLLG